MPTGLVNRTSHFLDWLSNNTLKILRLRKRKAERQREREREREAASAGWALP
jgi:hypothetical protein